MSAELLSDAIGLIDDGLVAEVTAAGPAVTEKKHWLMRRGIAACLCLALAAALALPFTRGDTAEAPAVSPGTPPAAFSAPPSGTPGTVLYSALPLPEGGADPEVLSAFAGAGDAMCLKAFAESDLSACAAVLEGTITDLYLKDYTYSLTDDKFGTEETYTYHVQTVVYELEVHRAWYGGPAAGTTLLVEDREFFPEEAFALKVGHSYVLPLYEAGEELGTIAHSAQKAEGDLRRDSVYSTLCPYHPQIEVTEDGRYIFPDDWATLAASGASRIVMDKNPDGYGAYEDRMLLLTGETFAQRMDTLLRSLK